MAEDIAFSPVGEFDGKWLAIKVPFKEMRAGPPVGDERMVGAINRYCRFAVAKLKLDILMLVAKNNDPVAALLARLGHAAGNLLGAAGKKPVHISGRRRQDQRLVIRRRNAFKAVRKLVLDIGCRDVSGAEPGLIHDRGHERDIVLNTFDVEAVERCSLNVERLVAVLAVRDQLGDHRVIEHRDLIAFAHTRIEAYRAAIQRSFHRRMETLQASDGWQELAVRVFGVYTAFDRPAVDLQVTLLDAQRLTISDAKHLLDEVDTRDHFRDRVLHLQTGVHFKEIEALVDAGRDKLDRAGAVIVHSLGQCDGLFTHLLAGCFIKQWAWRFLDDFLVAALDRAFALEQVDAVAVLVAQHLDFDVAWVEDELLDEDAVIAEGRLGFGLHSRKTLFDFLVIGGDSYTLAAAARRRLDHHRIADVLRDLHRFLGALDEPHMARHSGHACFGGKLLGTDLVAHRLNGVRIRADEDDILFLQALCEGRVLGKKAEAGVNRFGAGLLHRIDDLVHDKIGL